jgi:prophage regulatory protein
MKHNDEYKLNSTHENPIRLLGFEDLKREYGVCYTRVHINRLVKDSKFPAPIRVGLNRCAWVQSEIENWIREKIANRDNAAA